MSTFSDDVVRLERALTDAIPTSRDWVRIVDQATESWTVELTSPHVRDRRTLSIELHGGEIDVAFSVGPSGVGRGPYEANSFMPDEQETAELAAFANFVADFLDERIVLAMPRGWFGGREFLTVEELTTTRRQKLAWIASWRGTYDQAIPTA